VDDHHEHDKRGNKRGNNNNRDNDNDLVVVEAVSKDHSNDTDVDDGGDNAFNKKKEGKKFSLEEKGKAIIHLLLQLLQLQGFG